MNIKLEVCKTDITLPENKGFDRIFVYMYSCQVHGKLIFLRHGIILPGLAERETPTFTEEGLECLNVLSIWIFDLWDSSKSIKTKCENYKMPHSHLPIFRNPQN